jgi:superfamily I DNA/RNA helicase
MYEKISLSEEQRAIVEATESKIVVVATAAAGKTRCITERVRWLLEQGVAPEKIVAITFTNAAAEEISERLNNPSGVFIGTIHSLANYYLRKGGINTEKVLRDEKFDDLFKLIAKHPECVDEVEHLIVDESQDSSPIQFKFLLDIIQPKNYMLMGDHRQSIYRFANAHPEYLIGLMNNLDVTVYNLTENYRNSPEILSYAKALIMPLGYEYEDKSVPMYNKTRGRVVEVEYSADGIAKTIQRYATEGKSNYSDWFVLTRTNAELEEIRSYLETYNIPCDTFKKAQLDNKGLKDKMKENTVKVLTIHTAKGLEARNVVVIGTRWNDIEERCINYVAATRAQDLLVWTRKKAKYNRRKKEYGPKTTNWGG